MRQKSIFECSGRIGHKADACIIRGPNFLPQSLRKNMNKFNDIHREESNDSPWSCNRKPPAYQLKFSTYPPKTNPVVSDIMGRLNRYAIDNGGVEVHPSGFPFGFNSESFPDPDTTKIQSVHDNEMDHLLELFQ